MARASTDKRHARAMTGGDRVFIGIAVGAGLPLLVGAVFYGYLWTTGIGWDAMGDAVAPITSLLTALALFAALYSVNIQRGELELQRQELALTRGEMKEQRAQFERTAQAQEALAKAQSRANELALFAEEANRSAVLASLLQARVAIDVAQVRGQTQWFEGAVDTVHGRIDDEAERLERLRREIGALGIRPVVADEENPKST